MFTPIEGHLHAKDFRFALVVSRWNNVVTRRLLDGAIDCLSRHGAGESQYKVIYCPGSFEIPLVAKYAVNSEHYDAVICLGAIIRGDTPHFEYIAGEVTKGIAQLSLESEKPVAYGILTTDTMEQALERAGMKSGNKGWDAALSAIEMVNLLAQFKKSDS